MSREYADATRAFFEEFDKCEQKMEGGKLGLDSYCIREAIRNNPEGAKGFIDAYCSLAKNDSPRYIKLAYLVSHMYLEVFEDRIPSNKVAIIAKELGAEEYLTIEIDKGATKEIVKGQVLEISNDEAESSDNLDETEETLTSKLHQSTDLLNKRDWNAIIKLWEPYLMSSLFKVDIINFYTTPNLRIIVHGAKCCLFVARLQIRNSPDLKYNWKEAIRLLQELLRNKPYSGTNFSKATRNAQNLNYKDTLDFANSWFDYVGFSNLSSFLSIDESKLRRIHEDIQERLRELKLELDVQ